MKKIAILISALVLACTVGGLALADLNDGLVADYRFTNCSSDDVSGNGNHGTVYGADCTEDHCDKPDGALWFNRDRKDYVEVPGHDSLDPTDGLTISMYIKPILNGVYQGLIQKGTLQSFGSYEIHRIPTGQIRFILNNNADGNVLDSETIIPNMAWTHIAVTHGYDSIDDESRTKKIYINGGLETTQEFDYPINTDGDPLRIGMYYSSAFHFDGRIDQVRIYNRALPEDEISDLYEHEEALCDPTPPCDCDDSDGDGVPDDWDQCPDTPLGSAVYSNGCRAYCELSICALVQRKRTPGQNFRIFGSGFGSEQGDSVLHIGDQDLAQGDPLIKEWTYCKIKVEVPPQDCSLFNGDGLKKRVWVTVGDEDSNKKRLIILKPGDCP